MAPTSSTDERRIALALLDAGRLEEAAVRLERALAAWPEDIELRTLHGLVCVESGRVAAAIEAFRGVVAAEPGNEPAAWNLTLALLLHGDYEEGWALHERRGSAREHGELLDLAGKRLPRWRGESLDGCRLLVIGEQGLGDQVQFLRFVPMLAERGARVELGVAPQLARLAGAIPGVDRILSRREDQPGDCDRFTLLMSLPYHFDVRMTSIPARIPYLVPPEEEVVKWARELEPWPRPRVGLVWAGNRSHANDARRSLPVEALAPLGRLKNVSFVILQRDEPIPAWPNAMAVGPPLADLADAAALMQNLDLVVSVDTLAAHLAGALGRPACTLLPFAPDWRWLARGASSAWYPGMRLLRQPAPGSWEPVIDELVTLLRALTPP